MIWIYDRFPTEPGAEHQVPRRHMGTYTQVVKSKVKAHHLPIGQIDTYVAMLHLTSCLQVVLAIFNKNIKIIYNTYMTILTNVELGHCIGQSSQPICWMSISALQLGYRYLNTILTGCPKFSKFLLYIKVSCVGPRTFQFFFYRSFTQSKNYPTKRKILCNRAPGIESGISRVENKCFNYCVIAFFGTSKIQTRQNIY